MNSTNLVSSLCADVLDRLFSISAWRLIGPGISFISASLLVWLSDDEQQLLVFNAYIIQLVINSFEYPYFIAAKRELYVDRWYTLLGFLVVLFLGLYFESNVNDLVFSCALLLSLIYFSKIFYVEEEKNFWKITTVGIFRSVTINAVIILYVLDLQFLQLLVCALVCVSLIKRPARRVSALPAVEVILSFFAALFMATLFYQDRQMLLAFSDAKLVNIVVIASSVLMMLSNILAVTFYKTSKKLISIGLFYVLFSLYNLLALLCVLIQPDTIYLIYLLIPISYAFSSRMILRIQLENISVFLIPLLGVVLMKFLIMTYPLKMVNVQSVLILSSTLPIFLMVFLARKKGLEAIE